MKRICKNAVMLLACAALIVSMAAPAFAAITDMPDNWATEALEAAVANGLMYGNDQGLIEPDRALTRAELAAILVRAFDAKTDADISGFSDLNSGAWYYDYFKKAVKMEIFYGDADGGMRPDAPISREEAFTVIARVLVLSTADHSHLSKYPDMEDISSWARDSLSALSAKGYINGAGQNMYPKADITRAEFAQVMHNIIKQYIKNSGTYTEVVGSGAVLVSEGVNLKDITVNGDLIIADGADSQRVNFDDVTINGRLLVRGGNVDPDAGSSNTEGVVVKNVNNTVHFFCYETDSFVSNINAITRVTFDTPSGTISGGGSNTKTNLSTTPVVNDITIYADDVNNASLATLESLIPTASTSGGIGVTIAWNSTDTFDIKGGTYTFTGTVTPVNTSRYVYTGAAPVVTVTVTPVSVVSSSLNSVYYLRVNSVTVTDHASLGLPGSASLLLSSGNTIDNIPVAYTPGAAAVDITTLGTTDFTADFDVPFYLNNYNETVQVSVVNKDVIAVTAIAPTTGLTYGETLGNPSYQLGTPVTQIGTGATVAYSYSGTTASGAAYGPSATKPTQAGNYVVTATYEDSDNIGGGNASFVISPRPVTFTVDSVSIKERDAIPAFTATLTSGSYAYTDNYASLGITLSATATVDSTFGNYSVTGSAANANYSVTIDGADKLTITKWTLYVNIDGKIRSGTGIRRTFTYNYDYSPNSSFKQEVMGIFEANANGGLMEDLIYDTLAEVLYTEQLVDDNIDLIDDATGEILPYTHDFSVSVDRCIKGYDDLLLAYSQWVNGRALTADEQLVIRETYNSFINNAPFSFMNTAYANKDVLADIQIEVLKAAMDKRINDLTVADVFGEVPANLQRFLYFDAPQLAELKLRYNSEKLQPYIDMLETTRTGGTYSGTIGDISAIIVPADVYVGMIVYEQYADKITKLDQLVDMTDAASAAAWNAFKNHVKPENLLRKVSDTEYFLLYTGAGYSEDNAATYYFNFTKSAAELVFDLIEDLKPAGGYTDDQMIDRFLATTYGSKIRAALVKAGAILTYEDFDGASVDAASYDYVTAARNVIRLLRADVDSKTWDVLSAIGIEYAKTRIVYDSSKDFGGMVQKAIDFVVDKLAIIDGNYAEIEIDFDK